MCQMWTNPEHYEDVWQVRVVASKQKEGMDEEAQLGARADETHATTARILRRRGASKTQSDQGISAGGSSAAVCVSFEEEAPQPGRGARRRVRPSAAQALLASSVAFA